MWNVIIIIIVIAIFIVFFQTPNVHNNVIKTPVPIVIHCILSKKVSINLCTRAMSTKYVESEARVMSLVLIEGIAEVKRL